MALRAICTGRATTDLICCSTCRTSAGYRSFGWALSARSTNLAFIHSGNRPSSIIASKPSSHEERYQTIIYRAECTGRACDTAEGGMRVLVRLTKYVVSACLVQAVPSRWASCLVSETNFSKVSIADCRWGQLRCCGVGACSSYLTGQGASNWIIARAARHNFFKSARWTCVTSGTVHASRAECRADLTWCTGDWRGPGSYACLSFGARHATRRALLWISTSGAKSWEVCWVWTLGACRAYCANWGSRCGEPAECAFYGGKCGIVTLVAGWALSAVFNACWTVPTGGAGVSYWVSGDSPTGALVAGRTRRALNPSSLWVRTFGADNWVGWGTRTGRTRGTYKARYHANNWGILACWTIRFGQGNWRACMADSALYTSRKTR